MSNPEHQPKNTIETLSQYGATIEPDPLKIEGAYIVCFNFDEAVTTVRILLKDKQSGADLVITNMTTLPKDQVRKGFGSKAIVSILSWAHQNNLRDIRAVQVGKEESENFWIKNGFVKDKEPNPSNDFIYQIE